MLCVCAALPRSPTNLTAFNITSTSVHLRWKSGNGAEPIESYVIRYRRRKQGVTTPDAGYQELELIGGSRLEQVIGSLAAHVTYELQVIAVNNIGRSSPSNTIEVTTRESGENETLIIFGLICNFLHTTIPLVDLRS